MKEFIMQMKHGICHATIWNDTGRFVSFIGKRLAVVLAVRKSWRLEYLTPNYKPNTRRLYIGPFEIQITKHSKP